MVDVQLMTFNGLPTNFQWMTFNGLSMDDILWIGLDRQPKDESHLDREETWLQKKIVHLTSLSQSKIHQTIVSLCSQAGCCKRLKQC